jgi:hypothetical protein
MLAVTLEIKTSYDKIIRTQTNKQLLTFDIRNLFRMVYQFVCYSPDKHKFLTDNDFFRLWNSEANRTFADRIPELPDCIQFNMGLHDAAVLHFKHSRQESQHLLKPENLGKPLLSHINAAPSEFASTLSECP